MTPDSITEPVTILATIVISSLTAVGGFLAKGKFSQPRNDTPAYQPRCPQHDDMMIAVSKIPDMNENLKDMNAKLTKFIDIRWEGVMQVIRKHEHILGQLQGLQGMKTHTETDRVPKITEEE